MLARRKSAQLCSNRLAAALGLTPLPGTSALYGILDEYDDVMDDASVTGPDFGSLDPLVFAEVSRDRDVHVGYDAIRWNLDLFGNLDDCVRLADGPALDKLRCCRQIFGVAFRSPLVDPCRDRVDFFLAQPAIIQEMAMFRSSEPWRHSAALNFFLDRPGPGASIFVGQQSHRRYLASPVAFNAMGVENWSNVPAERDLCIRWPARGYSGRYRQREYGKSSASSECELPHNLPPGQLFWRQ